MSNNPHGDDAHKEFAALFTDNGTYGMNAKVRRSLLHQAFHPPPSFFFFYYLISVQGRERQRPDRGDEEGAVCAYTGSRP